MVFPSLSSLVSSQRSQMQSTNFTQHRFKMRATHCSLNLRLWLFYLSCVIAITVGVIYFQEALRKIPIQYAKRVTGRGQTTAGQQTHLPLKLNAAGVIPVIFASAFFITPQSIATFFGTNSVTTTITNVFDYTKPVGMVFYLYTDHCIHILLRIHSGESGEYCG